MNQNVQEYYYASFPPIAARRHHFIAYSTCCIASNTTGRRMGGEPGVAVMWATTRQAGEGTPIAARPQEYCGHLDR